MKIAIASGKGGTGKTTVSVNLAYTIKKRVQILDCDVEEPNCQLFLQATELSSQDVNVPVPEIDESLCLECGECAKFCEFNAIAFLGRFPLIFPEMCHSCGGCVELCPSKALSEIDKNIGKINNFQKGNILLTEGRLNIGVAMAPPLINAVKNESKENQIVILDAPPGTTCPVVATIQNADFVILVTEPTPFGLNDLKLAVDMVEVINIPYGVVINRVGVGDNKVQEFCIAKNIPILLEIPNDRAIAEVYSRGKLIVEELTQYQVLFENLLNKIEHLAVNEEK